MKKYKKIDYFKSLEECSKEQNADEFSEYDTMLAISRLPDEFTEKELRKEIEKVLLNRNISSLIDQGLLEACWDEAQQDFVFRAKA